MGKLAIILTAAMRKQAYEAMLKDMVVDKYGVLCSCMTDWLKNNCTPAFELYIVQGKDPLLKIMAHLLPELYAQRPHNDVLWWPIRHNRLRVKALQDALAMLQEKHPDLFTDSSTSP